MVKGRLVVHKVFRGVDQGELDYSKWAYKPDFALVPKDQEYKYIEAFEKFSLPDPRVFAARAEMPPLLKVNLRVYIMSVIFPSFS